MDEIRELPPEINFPVLSHDDRPFEQYIADAHASITVLVADEIAGFRDSDSLTPAKTYSLGLKGKLIRPILGQMSAELLDVPVTDIGRFLIATEKLHTASLDIDDIQDKALMRRGAQALHREFSTDTAILSTVSFIGSAFTDLASLRSRFPPERVGRLVEYCGEKLADLADGQHRDLTLSNRPIKEELEEVAILKTGPTLEMGMVGVAILAGSENKTHRNFKEYARHLALAFQTKDDVIDVTADPETTGKDCGLDANNGRLTMIDVCGGVKEAIAYMETERIRAKTAALQFPGNPRRFLSIVDYVVNQAF